MTAAWALGLSRNPLMTGRCIAAAWYDAAHAALRHARICDRLFDVDGFVSAVMLARQYRRRAREART